MHWNIELPPAEWFTPASPGLDAMVREIEDHTLVAIDTETMGLNPARDRLCLLQLSGGDGNAHLIQFAPNEYDAPNLKALLADTSILKIFHCK